MKKEAPIYFLDEKLIPSATELDKQVVQFNTAMPRKVKNYQINYATRLIGWLVLLFFVPTSILLLYPSIANFAVLYLGQRVPGMILKVEPPQQYTHGYITYNYQLGDKTLKSREAMLESEYPFCHEGVALEIKVIHIKGLELLPPMAIRVMGNSQDLLRTSDFFSGDFLLIYLITGIWLSITAAIVHKMIIKPRRAARLIATGAAAIGDITYSSTNGIYKITYTYKSFSPPQAYTKQVLSTYLPLPLKDSPFALIFYDRDNPKKSILYDLSDYKIVDSPNEQYPFDRVEKMIYPSQKSK